MYNTTKILLTIYMEGGTLKDSGEIKEIPYQIKANELYDKELGYNSKSDKVVISGSYKHKEKINNVCARRINICKATYYEWSDLMNEKCPHWERKGEWKKMTEYQRINSHAKRMCDHFNGTAYEFQILED